MLVLYWMFKKPFFSLSVGSYEQKFLCPVFDISHGLNSAVVRAPASGGPVVTHAGSPVTDAALSTAARSLSTTFR